MEDEKVTYRISRSRFEDLKKYVDINDPDLVFSKINYSIIDDYEEDASSPELIELISNYYDEHLPINITSWVRVNRPRPTLLYREGLAKQCVFVRDVLNEMLYEGEEESSIIEPQCVSFHTSKSVKLPVFMIEVKKLGLKLILRNNFYDWKMSVISKKPINDDFKGLFDSSKVATFCEGFPEKYIFGTILQNNKKFTIEVDNDYELYTVVYLIKRQLVSN